MSGDLSGLSVSVIIPSYRRPELLLSCLESLAEQERLPDEIVVVWQADDSATRSRAEQFAERTGLRLKVVHLTDPGIVPAENAGLAAATGNIIVMIDDDAKAPTGWLARHLAWYADPSVGAVGGHYLNFHRDGTPAVSVAPERIGELRWYGRTYGNLQNHVPEWMTRPPIFVSHLIGGNMSLRRCAFSRFEASLKPYWELFEMEACLQVARRGYRVLFDFGNPVCHYPVSRENIPERRMDGYQAFNLAYNHAFILSRHSPWWLRAPRLLYLLLVGSATRPGVIGFLVGLLRHRDPARRFSLFRHCVHWHLRGWADGSKTRALEPPLDIAAEAGTEFPTPVGVAKPDGSADAGCLR